PVVGIRLEGDALDRGGVGEHRLPDDAHGHLVGRVELLCDLLRLRGDLGEGLGPIEMLASGEKPNLVAVEGGGERGAGHATGPFEKCGPGDKLRATEASDAVD